MALLQQSDGNETINPMYFYSYSYIMIAHDTNTDIEIANIYCALPVFLLERHLKVVYQHV